MARVSRSDVTRLAKFPRNGAGAVRVPATVSRTGTQVYPEKGLVEYRPPEEVFAADSLASFAGVPVTFGHPAGGVTPANLREVQIGHVSDLPPEAPVKLDNDPNEWVKPLLNVGDLGALQTIEDTDGELEISCGYTCELEMTPGIAPDGTKYDAIQRQIRINHVAILAPNSRARAGQQARLRLDNKDTMKVIVIDGAEYEVGSEKHIAKLQSDAAASVAAATARADAAEAKADAATERADAAEAKLTNLDSLVEERFHVLKSAAQFLPATYDTKGKSNAEVRKDALEAALGADAIKGKSEVYVEARFDALCDSDAPANYVASAPPAPRPAEPKADVNDDEAFRASLNKKEAK